MSALCPDPVRVVSAFRYRADMTSERLVLNGGTYKLAELVDESNNLIGVQATNATFVGPAVIAFLGTRVLDGSQFGFGSSGPESILWDLGDKKTIVGAIGITDSSFINCTFRGIGVAGDHDSLTAFLSEVMTS